MALRVEVGLDRFGIDHEPVAIGSAGVGAPSGDGCAVKPT